MYRPAYAQPSYSPAYAQPQVTYAQPQPTYAPQPVMMAQPQVQPAYSPQPVMMAQPQPVMTAMPRPVMTAMPQAQPMYMQQPQMVMGPRPRKGGPGGQPCPDNGSHAPLTGNVHMLVTGIDYACDRQSWAGPPPNGHGPLDTKYAFNMMIDLAQQSGVTSLTQLWNEQCTKENICANIMQVGRRCGPGDTFIFYYTGHGDQLPNNDPNDPEQQDQCLCTVDAAGNTDDPSMRYREQVWLRDDAIAGAIQSAVTPQAKSLILIDACHSGTICDFSTNPKWRGMTACSISGCQDTQTSAGTGKGGVYTRALTLAIEECQQRHGHNSFNVSCVYNDTLQKYRQTNPPGHEQNISIHGVGCYPQNFPWPLQPRGQYISPVNRQQQAAPIYAAPAVQYAAPVQYAAAPVQYAAPATTYARPVQYAAPAATYAAPISTYAAPISSYATPISTYAAPVATYAAPVATYAPPATTYAAPVATYAAPATTYAAPVRTAYAAPAYGTISAGSVSRQYY